MLRSIAVSATGSNCQVHTVSSAREAFALIDRFGDQISAALIDYDFPGEGQTGADIIRKLRRANARACITCATARSEGAPFNEARGFSLAAGADEAVCTQAEGFEDQLRALVA